MAGILKFVILSLGTAILFGAGLGFWAQSREPVYTSRTLLASTQDKVSVQQVLSLGKSIKTLVQLDTLKSDFGLLLTPDLIKSRIVVAKDKEVPDRILISFSAAKAELARDITKKLAVIAVKKWNEKVIQQPEASGRAEKTYIIDKRSSSSLDIVKAADLPQKRSDAPPSIYAAVASFIGFLLGSFFGLMLFLINRKPLR
jgi:uncharacterized protein involved in exopolysaccharide biosynthesis